MSELNSPRTRAAIAQAQAAQANRANLGANHPFNVQSGPLPQQLFPRLIGPDQTPSEYAARQLDQRQQIGLAFSAIPLSTVTKAPAAAAKAAPSAFAQFAAKNPKATIGAGLAGAGLLTFGAAQISNDVANVFNGNPTGPYGPNPNPDTPAPPTPNAQGDPTGVYSPLDPLSSIFNANNAPRPTDPGPLDAIVSPFLGISDAFSDIGAGTGYGIAATGQGFGDLFSFTGQGVGTAAANIGAGAGNAVSTLGTGAARALIPLGIGALILAGIKDKGVRKSVQGLDKPKPTTTKPTRRPRGPRTKTPNAATT